MGNSLQAYSGACLLGEFVVKRVSCFVLHSRRACCVLIGHDRRKDGPFDPPEIRVRIAGRMRCDP